MGNIKNYTLEKLDFKLSNSEYYDFYLNSDAIKNTPHYSSNTIVSFDFSTYETFGYDFLWGDFLEPDFTIGKRDDIISSVGWSGSISSDFSATTYGLTGFDNMALLYDEAADDFGHTTLLSGLTGTTLIHTPNDSKLVLNRVSGATGGYIYPNQIMNSTEPSGNYMNLRGGFLQGYYKLDGYDYQVLPTRYEKGFTVETWLQPDFNDYTPVNTLNESYTGNTGFFFYTGTRAENKFWNVFSGITPTDLDDLDFEYVDEDFNELDFNTIGRFYTEIRETDVEINNVMVASGITKVMTNLSVPLSPPPVDLTLIKNQFLIFGRSFGKTCGGDTSDDGFGQTRADYSYDKDVPFYSSIVRQETVDFQNQFLTFGRSFGKTCGGDTSDDGFGQTRADYSFSGFTQDVMELDKDADIIDNAIGFRIREDGSIGYRLLTVSADCQTVEMIEEYSDSGIVNTDQWQHIVVKWVNNDDYSECDLVHSDPRKGHFKFYVNSNLIFISKELNEFIPKRLYELQEKQVGVPYNISIGGGTQGLLESLTFDGQDPADLGLVIEQNFAGSFIGYMSTFNLFNKNLSWCEIKDIYNSTKAKYI